MPSYYDSRNPVCKACRRLRPCLGRGPTPNRLLWLGEGPGDLEDRIRIPFVGNSGKELDHQYLPLSGLSRPDQYITNAIKCRQGKKGGDSPIESDVLACARHHLPGEFAKVQPSIVVTLGAVALRLFGPHHSLEMHHGRPLYNQTFAQWEGTVFPIYHPAFGLRQSEAMIDLQSDFRDLRLFLRGKLKLPTDQYPNPDYRALRTLDDFVGILNAHPGAWESNPGLEIAIDTETDEGVFWCLTFSMQPGTGYMIRADNHELLRVFRAWLHTNRPLVIFHNYLFDQPVLRQVQIVADRWIDTMQEAYEVGHLPQALKVLAFRLCGMEMQEYEDLVLPYAIDQAIEYLYLGSKSILPEFIADLPWKNKTLRCSGAKAYGGKHVSTPITFTQPDTLSCPVCSKPKLSGNMERDKGGRQYIWDRCQDILTDTMEENANPLKRWAAIPPEERAVMEAVIGTMPRPSIDRVPFLEALWYACRDPDATLRIKPLIRSAAAELGRRTR